MSLIVEFEVTEKWQQKALDGLWVSCSKDIHFICRWGRLDNSEGIVVYEFWSPVYEITVLEEDNDDDPIIRLKKSAYRRAARKFVFTKDVCQKKLEEDSLVEYICNKVFKTRNEELYLYKKGEMEKLRKEVELLEEQHPELKDT